MRPQLSPPNVEPRLVQVPNDISEFKGDGVLLWLKKFSRSISDDLRNRLALNVPNDGLLLKSPGGKIYQIVVSDAGVVSATYIQG